MKKIITTIYFIIVITALFIYMPLCTSAADVNTDMDIRVFIDGEEIEFDVKPTVINQRTMVPMRFIFEYFGLDVEWNQDEQSIRADLDNGYIFMQLNSKLLQVINYYDDNTKIYLDVAPCAIRGRTLVPLRAIAELFNATVEWEQETKSVIITTPYPKNLDQTLEYAVFDPYTCTVANSPVEFLTFTFNGPVMNVSGVMPEDYFEIHLRSYEHSGFINEYDNGCFLYMTAKAGEEFNYSVDLSNLIKLENSKDYTNFSTKISVFRKKDVNDKYWWRYGEININTSNDELSISKSIVFDHNYEFVSNWVAPMIFLKDIKNQELIDLSNLICQDINDDYEKVLRIHDWVCENIYYDYDWYYGKTENTEFFAIDVLHSKKTVCAGYANLLQALIQAQNIPCRQISGYALGLSTTGIWNETSAATTGSNHAWNQAYVNNRWVNIDATWDSGNDYEDGEYISGDMNHTYFDISLATFSESHKFLK